MRNIETVSEVYGIIRQFKQRASANDPQVVEWNFSDVVDVIKQNISTDLHKYEPMPVSTTLMHMFTYIQLVVSYHSTVLVSI